MTVTAAPTRASQPPATQPAPSWPSPRAAALIAGASYLALFVFGIFGNFAVREQLVVAGDATATAQNIADNHTLVRLAIAAFIAAFALDVLVAWALYYLFRAAAPAAARLTAWFRLLYTVFLGVAVVFLFAAVELTGASTGVGGLDEPARDAHTLLALNAFNATWLVGLTCFGVHLAITGTICIRTGIASRALGIALVIAGAAYLFDTFAYTLLPDYADHKAVFTAIVAVPAILAEAGFTYWLLRRAGRPTERLHRA